MRKFIAYGVDLSGVALASYDLAATDFANRRAGGPAVS